MAENRLLVVDDLPEMCEVVRVLGDDLCFEVTITTHGHDFMREMESFDPTTVLIDIVMPGVDGFDLVRWLGDRGSDARVIVASAVNREYAELAAKLASAFGLDAICIQKPFLVEELSRVLADRREEGVRPSIASPQ